MSEAKEKCLKHNCPIPFGALGCPSCAREAADRDVKRSMQKREPDRVPVDDPHHSQR